ncbi:uncharacterized protein TNCV_2292651 [Trichonephila clavipes]|nr:uncharacterized protein TNCV_2292651 [Trichonephila clavipes]
MSRERDKAPIAVEVLRSGPVGPRLKMSLVICDGPRYRAVGSLVVRTSDSRPEGLGDWKIFPYPSVPCLNCGGGDRGCVAIYRPFGEFRRAKSYCHLYGAQGQHDRRTSIPMPQ